MDFSNRDIAQPVPATGSQHSGVPSPQVRKGSTNKDNGQWGRVGVVAAVVSVVILLLALVVLACVAKPTSDDESKYVYTNKLQAVFLDTGQVYFGNLKVLNDNYFVLTNIFYLQTSSSSGSSTSSSNTSSSVSLVKLGCELHQPYDQMVINRAEVTFWENLQSTGQVAKAVANWEAQNPQGQKCSDQSSSASTNSVDNTQSANTSNPAPTTNSSH